MASMTPTKRKALAAAMATALAIPAEGIYQIAYYDPPGILTVCMGHTGKDVIKGKRYSLAECDALLTSDMKKAIEITDRCMPGLPVESLAAFSDAVFNLGSIVCDPVHSTLTRKWRAGDLKGACEQLPRWNKARVAGIMISLPGLTKRRNAEMALCLVPFQVPAGPSQVIREHNGAYGIRFATWRTSCFTSTCKQPRRNIWTLALTGGLKESSSQWIKQLA